MSRPNFEVSPKVVEALKCLNLGISITSAFCFSGHLGIPEQCRHIHVPKSVAAVQPCRRIIRRIRSDLRPSNAGHKVRRLPLRPRLKVFAARVGGEAPKNHFHRLSSRWTRSPRFVFVWSHLHFWSEGISFFITLLVTLFCALFRGFVRFFSNLPMLFSHFS